MFKSSIMTTTVLAVTEENSITQQFQPSMAGLFLRAVISMVVILLLTYLVLRVIKKQHDMQQRIQYDRKGWVRIYDYQALGPNKGIYLIELFSHIFVVGVSDNGINVLKEVAPDDDEWLAIKETLESSEEIIPPGITRFFKKKLNVLNKNDSNESVFKHELSEQLNAEVNDQLNRTHRLFRQISKGGGDGE